MDARADVIHKHGIGSCRGTLVATAARTALANIEVFEVKADNLFVFQRDVEKARERLLKGDQPSTN